MTDPLEAGSRFRLAGKPISCEPYGDGHIHDTYLLQAGEKLQPSRYILQRMNNRVFAKPEAVQDNIYRIHSWLEKNPGLGKGLCLPGLVLTSGDRDIYRDAEGNFWRCFEFIENAVTLEKVSDPEQAFEGGRCFGVFIGGLIQYDPRRLHVTIPNFMDMEWRQKQLIYAELIQPGKRHKKVQSELARIRGLSEIPDRFIRIRHALPDRVVHNDTKISNILFEANSGRGLCVIDLDTVMTGTLLTDFGDMVRSFTASGTEDDPAGSECRTDLFEGLASGFCGVVSSFVNDIEKSNLLLGAKAVIYMQAIRFLADYLQGDTYYKTSYPDHNLDRARNQLGLLESLLAKEERLLGILEDCF